MLHESDFIGLMLCPYISNSSAGTSKISSSQASKSYEEQWQGIQGYIDVNKHISGVEQGRYAAKVSMHSGRLI